MPQSPSTGNPDLKRLIDLSTVLSGHAQLLKEANLDNGHEELLAEVITAADEVATLCRRLQK